MPEVEAEKIARELIPAEAEITDINFDPSLGEIIIETKKPGLSHWKKWRCFAGNHKENQVAPTCFA